MTNRLLCGPIGGPVTPAVHDVILDSDRCGSQVRAAIGRPPQ
jgi:hypothetical protein